MESAASWGNVLLVLEILIIPIIVVVVINYAKTLSLEGDIRNLKHRLDTKDSAYEKMDHKVDELKEDMAVIKNVLARVETRLDGKDKKQG